MGHRELGQSDIIRLRTTAKCCGAVCWHLVAAAAELRAQKAPYDVFPPAEPPY